MARKGRRKGRLTYTTDDAHRQKHHGTSSEPSVSKDPDDGKLVGHCSSDIDTDLAQELLDDGLPWSPKSWRKAKPKEVFNVFQGVPYRAHKFGRAYRGFPDVPRNIPEEVREELRKRAVEDGFEEVFDAWMRNNESL